MILPEHKDVFVYRSPIDMRKSFDGLFKLVRQHGIFDGGLYLFVSKNRKRAKIIFWDGSGLLILMKRMEYGRFTNIWRRNSLSYQELSQFLSGSSTVVRSNYEPKKLDIKTCASGKNQAYSLHEEIRT